MQPETNNSIPESTTAPTPSVPTQTPNMPSQPPITIITEPTLPLTKPQRPNKNKSKILITVIIILVIALVVATGAWALYKNHDKTPPAKTAALSTVQTNNSVSSPPPSAYTGWKTATLKYEKLSFKYPDSWTLVMAEWDATTNVVTTYSSTVSSESAENSGCGYPGEDNVTISASNGDNVNIYTGNPDCSGDYEETQGGSTPINVFGSKYYLSFINDESNPCEQSCTSLATSSSVNNACLSTSDKIYIPPISKNVYIPAKNQSTTDNVKLSAYNNICFNAANAASSATSVTNIENNPNFSTAKLIIETLEYSS